MSESAMSIKCRSALDKAIVRTIVFFDLFEYPLTDTEIRRFFPEYAPRTTLMDIRTSLAASAFLAQTIEEKDGLYCLSGRGDIRELRGARALSSYRKFRRARRLAALLAHVPFVRMIAVCNTLGLNAARDESDIDFFIVVRTGHLWLARLWCAGIAHLLGVRPWRGHERDALCLSFYVADTALDLSCVQLSGWTPDVYLAHWVAWCVPLYDDGVSHDFFHANSWIASCLPNVVPPCPISRRRVVLAPGGRFLKRFSEALFCSHLFERTARAFQLRIAPPAIRDQMNKGTGVVVNDAMLKFHTADRRQEIKERFIKKCKEWGIP